jgi:hypothetical protein
VEFGPILVINGEKTAFPEYAGGLAPRTAIGDSAFAWCGKLTSVTLPANLALGSDPFPGSLAAVYNNGGKQAGRYALANGAWTRAGDQ